MKDDGRSISMELQSRGKHMKVLLINAVCGTGSTGRIVADLWATLKAQGHEAKVAYGVGKGSLVDPQDRICFNNKVGYYAHNIAAKLTDKTGLFSAKQTRNLIKQIKAYDPDIIHLHNLHGYYMNYKLLFEYLAQADKPVVWTLHDCWAFTGHCSYFSAIKCEQWKKHCTCCKQLRNYPACYLSGNVSENYETKKAAFTSVKNMTIITPSQWLAGLVGESFLSKYPVKVINNGIDLNIFTPTPSDFKKKHNIEGKTVVLAVANVWGVRKGYNDVLKLAGMLDPSYQVVMVGVTDHQMQEMPNNILAIKRTSSAKELAEIYSAADVFVNPSYEETFGMVTAEALACGTPVVTYDKTAVPEVADNTCGIVVHAGDIAGMKEAIMKVRNLDRNQAIRRAKIFKRKKIYGEYSLLYNFLCEPIEA